LPIHNTQVQEYECCWCRYKWINRFDGKDGPIPNRCARCKKSNWDHPNERITPYLRKLRNKIRRFNELYRKDYRQGHSKPDDVILFPADLSEKFLNITNPKPTKNELESVIKPLNWDVHSNLHRTTRFKGEICFIPSEYAETISDFIKLDSCWIPIPNKPGYVTLNYYNQCCEWSKMLKYEAEARIQKILEIMKSRGVDYDPAPAIQKRKEEYLLEIQKRKEMVRTIDVREWAEKTLSEQHEYKKKLRTKKSEQTKRWWANRRQNNS
jgi:hypothetical protein